MRGHSYYLAGREPRYDGKKLPSFHRIEANERQYRVRLDEANQAFVTALLAYGARHGGLPNLSADECYRGLGAMG